jgi:hypothetical protein
LSRASDPDGILTAQAEGLSLLDVFELHRNLVEDYGEFARSFVNIADQRIRDHVDPELKGGLLWPEPLIQLNPAFESERRSTSLSPGHSSILNAGESSTPKLCSTAGEIERVVIATYTPISLGVSGRSKTRGVVEIVGATRTSLGQRLTKT